MMDPEDLIHVLHYKAPYLPAPTAAHSALGSQHSEETLQSCFMLSQSRAPHPVCLALTTPHCHCHQLLQKEL